MRAGEFLLLLLVLTAVSGIAAPPRPNIVLLMADDLGWGDVGYNGHPVIKTPHLDAMAGGALRFDRFYAPTVCSPTRGSCLTGRHPYRYGIFGANVGHLPAQERSLAEVLKSVGYATGHFGKWHLGTLTRTEKDANRGGPSGVAHYAPPWEHGFDHTFSTESKVPTWDPMLKPKGRENAFWPALDDPAAGDEYGTAYWSNGQRVPPDQLRGDDSKLIMDRALAFIRATLASDRPFFAVIWFHAPHLPVVAGPEFQKLYPDATLYERQYYGCITALDEQVGRLRKELRELQAAKNTMLWFCSDNGPEGQAGSAPGSAGPFRGRKRDLWEGGIRVPGLLEWPAIIQNPSVIKAPCVTSDYFPTVLDYLELPGGKPGPRDGISLRPLIEGKVTNRPAPIGFELGRMAAWIDNDYKLVVLLQNSAGRSASDAARAGSAGKVRKGKTTADRDSAGAAMLFNIVADPGETRDLADSQPERVRSMLDALEKWRASCRSSNEGNDYR